MNEHWTVVVIGLAAFGIGTLMAWCCGIVAREIEEVLSRSDARDAVRRGMDRSLKSACPCCFSRWDGERCEICGLTRRAVAREVRL